MSIAHLLAEFGSGPDTARADEPASEEAQEMRRLEVFEEGYRAGWDDASRAQAEDQSRIGADLARNLQEISFSYREAYAQVIRGLSPVFSRIVENLLPDLARQTLGPRIVEELTDLARSATDGEIVVTVSPDTETAISDMLASATSLPVTLRTDPMLGAGQVELSVGSAEREIDLDAAIKAIAEAVDAFLDETELEKRHG